MLNTQFISFFSPRLGLALIFTLLMAASSWGLDNEYGYDSVALQPSYGNPYQPYFNDSTVSIHDSIGVINDTTGSNPIVIVPDSTIHHGEDPVLPNLNAFSKIADIPNETYSGDSICPTPDIDVPDSLKPFVKDTDYKVYCYDNVNAGEAILVVEGIGNYAGTIETIFIINKAPLTVTAQNDTIAYGDEPSNAGVVYSGFVGDDDESSLDDSLIFSYEYGQYGKPGDYAIIPSGPRSENYEIEFIEGKLTVLPKKLTITAQNDTIVYGDEPSNAGVEYSGFVGDDDESSLDDSLIFSYEYGQYGKPGVYAIIPSGPRSDKYEIEFVEGKLTVEPKRISIVWQDDTLFTYDGEAHAPKATAAGIVNNDSCGLTIAGAATNAGKYTAKVTELSNKNYKLPATGLEQAFEIKKANSSIVKAPTAIENLVYNGKVQTLVTAGEAQNGTFVYKFESDEKYSESLPTAKDAGTYTIYFMVQGNENYNSTEAQKITATIEKAPESSSSSVVVSSSSELPKSSSSSVVVSSSSEKVESSSSEKSTLLEIARNAGALNVIFIHNELTVTNAAASELKIFIFDMQGNLKKVYRGNTAGNHSIPLNKMSHGMYLARVVSGSSVQTLRINVK